MTDTSEKLEPCPLNCGGEVYAGLQRDERHEIQCCRCGLLLSTETREEGFRRWNTRPASEGLADDLRKCISMLDLDAPSGGWIFQVMDKAVKELSARPAPDAEQLSSDEAGTGRSGELISPVASTGGRRRATLDQPARPEEASTIGQSSLGQTAPDALREALTAAKELIIHERQIYINGYTILYTKDPEVGQLTAEGKGLVAPFNEVLAKIDAALASPPIASEPLEFNKSEQAYQVIGYLLSERGDAFESNEGQRALDYFSGDTFDAEFLPWPRERADLIASEKADGWVKVTLDGEMMTPYNLVAGDEIEVDGKTHYTIIEVQGAGRLGTVYQVGGGFFLPEDITAYRRASGGA